MTSDSDQTASRSIAARLRQEESALDRKASLVDVATDIDYLEASAIIWRCLGLVRYFWQRWAVVLTLGWIGNAATIALAPWFGKFLVDHVVLTKPIPNSGCLLYTSPSPRDH